MHCRRTVTVDGTECERPQISPRPLSSSTRRHSVRARSLNAMAMTVTVTVTVDAILLLWDPVDSSHTIASGLTFVV